MSMEFSRQVILDWVVIPFPRGSSWPRNWTRVFCFGGRFANVWATKEVVVQSFTCVWLCTAMDCSMPGPLSITGRVYTAPPWTAACQAPLSITNRVYTAPPWTAACQAPRASPTEFIQRALSRWCIQPSHPLLSPFLPASIFASIWFFSNESALRIRWSKYWSFSFSTSPSNESSGSFPSGLTRLISLLTREERVINQEVLCFPI